MSQQKNYIKTLPRDKNSNEKAQNPPIQTLLHVCLDYLERIRDKSMKYTIRNFADVIHTILQCQGEEWELSFKYAKSRKELHKRVWNFDNRWNKHTKGKPMNTGHSMRIMLKQRHWNLKAMRKHTKEMCSGQTDVSDESTKQFTSTFQGTVRFFSCLFGYV